MALAFANVTQRVALPGPGPQGYRVITADITLDTSYPTGGTAGIAAALGLGRIDVFDVIACGGYTIDYLVASDKLKCYQQPAAAGAGPSPEVPNATNLSGTTVHVFAIGT